jgi:hypothetical protein
VSARADSSVVVRTAIGARRAERLILDQALAAAERLRLRGELSRGVVVVVPSRSLRLHLMARLVAERGASLLGVRCSTHFGLALQILERSGDALPWDLDLFPILARRFARREEALAAALEPLHEGYSGVLGAVRDLLDAGFEIEHLEAVEEALEADGPQRVSRREVERARAVARVTARVLAAFAELGTGRTSTLLQTATRRVREDPAAALAAHTVLLHGFADATGVTSDFLEALLRAYGGAAVIDRPPDPVVAGTVDPSARFTRRLEGRLEAVGRVEEDLATAPPVEIALFRAIGEEAEVREVGHRCLDRIAAGLAPESIGVVMREPAPYVTVLRTVFGELALPFSAIGLRGPATPVGRRLRAAIELVLSGSRTHVERWLDALSDRPHGTPLFDLRIALASLGVARLEELARLQLDASLVRERYPLPVRHGFVEIEEEAADEPRVVRSRQRSVPAEALRRLQADALRLVELLDAWLGARLPLPAHVERAGRLVRLLGWAEQSEESRALAVLTEPIATAPPVVVDQEEFAMTLRRAGADAERAEVGGRGGGVQVMGVVDARARTFRHLFLLGMNRGVFPRTVREDPVLSDPLRKLLERDGHGILPDLPVKRRGYEEERYLFAQLLSSSPELTLSWLERDEVDRPTPPSPLVERLRWCHPDRPAAWREAPLVGRNPLLDLGSDGRPDPSRLERLPPAQQGVLAALYGRTGRLASILPEVLARSPAAGDDLDLELVAAARIAVLDELDPTRAAAARSALSPFFGFIGRPRRDRDPRIDRVVWVTALERMAVCPWQTLVERLLRVEAVPDPLDALPGIDALLVGSLVHRVLERILTDALGERPASMADLASTPAATVPWPPPDRLAEITAAEAARVVRSAGIALRGFDRALAAVVEPYLEVARRMDWAGGHLSTLAAEVEGRIGLRPGGPAGRSIGFRADRVDRLDDGSLVLTDYKTGTSPFTQSTPRYRRDRLLRDVRSGRRLQPVAYSLVGGERTASGRLTFLRPDLDLATRARAIAAAGDDAELLAAFHDSVGTILRAWDEGVFFPRMEYPADPQTMPRDCRWCAVAEACLRQDSGARRRLREGIEELGRAEGTDRSPGPIDEAVRSALLDHWWLAATGGRPEEAA